MDRPRHTVVEEDMDLLMEEEEWAATAVWAAWAATDPPWEDMVALMAVWGDSALPWEATEEVGMEVMEEGWEEATGWEGVWEWEWEAWAWEWEDKA